MVGPPGTIHLSIYNAIELGLLLASRQHQQGRRRYQNSSALPWKDHELPHYGNNPKHNVISPTTPFLGENFHVFGNGPCYTVHDHGPAQAFIS